MRQCQSCGMPLVKDPNGKGGGTEKDGAISTLYCSLCYRDGQFCYAGNDVHEFQDIVASAMKKSGYGWVMRKLTRWQIPHLGRRKKEEPKKLRFKRKSYGRGWTPSSRQGRLVLLAYVVLVLGRAFFYNRLAYQDQQMRVGTDREVDAGGNLFVFILPVLLLTAVLLLICYMKGETPRRQWGKKE